MTCFMTFDWSEDMVQWTGMSHESGDSGVWVILGWCCGKKPYIRAP